MRRQELDDLIAKHCPHTPYPKQADFATLDCTEAFYGGAAGGGKSDALLMAALRFAHVPGYSALILRRDFARLALPGSIMDRALAWLYGKPGTRWNASQKTFRFASGATLQFGYIDNPIDRFRYASSEYQYIGFDELTEFRLTDDEDNPYLFMFSRLRKTKQLNVPLRFRSASNPGNIGHEWVKKRFLPAGDVDLTQFERWEQDGRVTIPAFIHDNPALSRAEYEQGLAHLPPITRARLMRGDWTIREDAIIRPDWLRYFILQNKIIRPLTVAGEPIGPLVQIDERDARRIVTVDTAGTSKEKAAKKKTNPSWSVAQVWDIWPSRRMMFLRHVWRDRCDWSGLKAGVANVIERWRPNNVYIENAHHGVPLGNELQTAGHSIEYVEPRGGKLERSVTLQNWLAEGRVYLPKSSPPWLEALQSEWLGWTGADDETSDQIDTAAYAAKKAESMSPVASGARPVIPRRMNAWG